MILHNIYTTKHLILDRIEKEEEDHKLLTCNIKTLVYNFFFLLYYLFYNLKKLLKLPTDAEKTYLFTSQQSIGYVTGVGKYTHQKYVATWTPLVPL